MKPGRITLLALRLIGCAEGWGGGELRDLGHGRPDQGNRFRAGLSDADPSGRLLRAFDRGGHNREGFGTPR
jgi:hypothetical protein